MFFNLTVCAESKSFKISTEAIDPMWRRTLWSNGKIFRKTDLDSLVGARLPQVYTITCIHVARSLFFWEGSS